MHLKGHTLLKIRRFLNHKIAAGLEEVETLDQKLIDAYRGWVQGPRGVTGHDGSFPSNDEALPLVIIEFEAEDIDTAESEEAQLQVQLSEDEQAERRRELERAAEVMRKRREAEMEERQARFRRQAPQQSEPEDGGSISFTTETGFQKNQDE